MPSPNTWNCKRTERPLGTSCTLYVFFYKHKIHICFFLDLPQSTIQLGGSLDSKNIREFDDVYFECK